MLCNNVLFYIYYIVYKYNYKVQECAMNLQILNKKGAEISPELIGLFIEDINFAGDGGIYAELIENRSFEAKEAFGTPGYYYAVDDNMYAWSGYSESGNLPRLQIISGVPVSVKNPHYLRVTTSEKGQGFKNKAYDGIALKKGLNYHVSFYAKPVTLDGDTITVKVQKDGKVYAEGSVTLKPVAPYMPFSDLEEVWDLDPDNGWEAKIIAARKYVTAPDADKYVRQNDWTKYELDITAVDDVRFADFVMTIGGVGAIEFDFISMIPGDAVKGIFRKDIFDTLESLNPGFIRFPGGCIVEGIDLETHYPWKDTLCRPEDRKYIPNLWAFDDDRFKDDLDNKRPDSHYGQSFGIGYYEYFLMCELLKAQPLPVLCIGAACQFRSSEILPIDSDEFKEYVQDALDLIEFANGPVDSKWGAVRAKLGHPQPFNLKYVAIGNEQWETKYLDFYKRYDIFEQAIHEKYPEMLLLGSAGPNVDMGIAKDAWKYYRDSYKNNKTHCYAVDEHYYVSPEWLYNHYDMYDSYERGVNVFAGEYAGHPEGRENTMVGALAEAALLCGIEKNADVVKLASYAPLFNRIGHSQWKPNMIWFDDNDVFITPSYQVQKMFANNLGANVIPLNGQELELAKDKVYVSLSEAADGHKILKVVNANSENYVLTLTDENNAPLNAKAKVQVLQSAGERPEDHPEPSEIVTCTVDISGSVTLEGKKFYVIEF